MRIQVLKFGGTSISNVTAIKQVATRVAAARTETEGVVVVVSAMGATTDNLVKMASLVSSDPLPRELDMLLSSGEQVSIALLAMALAEQGQPALSFTGSQIGLYTNHAHTRAKILSIDREQIRNALTNGQVVVVAGFQGISQSGQITTLGRGGSDTTALALAAALRAESCEIFTDVDGIFTADPRLVKPARKLTRISYDEMLELAILGAGVMHPRSIVFGQKYGIPIHVRNSKKLSPGTLITGADAMMEEAAVVGCALKADLGRITLLGLPSTAGIQAQIFAALGDDEIFVDDIIQTTAGPEQINISFTVDHLDLADVKPAMTAVLRELGQGELSIDVGLSKVSVVGLGMRSQTGVAAKMFDALKEAGISILNITTSEIKISCIVNRPDGVPALRAVHHAFKLDRIEEEVRGTGIIAEPPPGIGERSVLLSEAVRASGQRPAETPQ